jgi:N-methylhydantoinase B
MDPVQLEIFSNRMSAIAEEMGILLCRTAYSPNITERHDSSCAVFNGRGEMVAQAAHIPVHLGSTPLSVKAAIERTAMEPGDVVILNDPFAGGTHLPDLTMVAPVFARNEKRPIAFVANRAHHADVGGMTPGSMPLSTDIFQEGIRIPPVKLVRRGKIEQDIWQLLLNNVRTPQEREGDLKAQWGSLRVGGERLLEEAKTRGLGRLAREMDPDRTVFSLDQFGCLCSTMFRVSPNHLLWILEGLVDGEVHNRIVVPDDRKHWTKIALERMLSIL